MNIKTRLKNYGLWVAVIAFVPIFLKGIGIDILPGNYTDIATGLLGIFVLLGIINNPTTDNTGFKDDAE